MAFETQTATNTSNPHLPTTPTTPETTPRAAKPGFYAKQAVLLTPEDHQAFEALTVAFRFELHPAGPIERALYTQILLAAWNIERANRLEAALAADGIDPLLSSHHEKTLDRIATHRMRAERTFHKCLKEIQAYQAAHPLDEPILRNEPKPEMRNEAKSVQPNETTISEHKFSRDTTPAPGNFAPVNPPANTKTALCGTNPIPSR